MLWSGESQGQFRNKILIFSSIIFNVPTLVQIKTPTCTYSKHYQFHTVLYNLIFFLRDRKFLLLPDQKFLDHSVQFLLLCQICLKAASGDNTWICIDSGKFGIVNPNLLQYIPKKTGRSHVANITLVSDFASTEAVLI